MTFCVVSYFFWGVEGSLARAFAKMLGKVKVFFSSCLWIADWGREKECFVDSRRRPNSLSPFLSGSVMLVVFSALFFFFFFGGRDSVVRLHGGASVLPFSALLPNPLLRFCIRDDGRF